MLIVDDNAANRDALAEQMRSWGMVADAVPGGDEALAAIRRRPLSAAFDVIVVDATMPGMDGNTLANAIRSDPSLAKTPLIMMGAAKKAETSPARNEDDCEHWLSKPVRPSYLRATLLSVAGVAGFGPSKGRSRTRPAAFLGLGCAASRRRAQSAANPGRR